MSDAALDLDVFDNPNGFYAPSPFHLIKASTENGEWVVYLEASNENKDKQNESVAVEALKSQKDYFLRKGVLSWDHLHKIEKDPSYVIGEPIDVRFADSSTLIKGRLYKKNRYAQGVWENLDSQSTRYGSSIGGYTLKKSKDGMVTRVIWDEVAITHNPVNDTVLGNVSVVPFQAFMKALTAGGGVDASQFTGGRALQPESLNKTLSDLTFGQTDVSERMMYSLVRDTRHKIMKGELSDPNEFISFVKARDLVADSEVESLAKRVLEYVKNPVVDRI